MLNSGVKRTSQSTGRNPALPRNRSKVSRKFWLMKSWSPRPKKGKLPGLAELTSLGAGRRRVSTSVSLIPVKFRKFLRPKIG